MKSVDISKPDTLKNRFFRLLIEGQDGVLCIPSPGQKHTKFSIPKNSIIKIIDFNAMSDIVWFEIEYCNEKYLFSGPQVEAYFMPIRIKNG